MTAPAEERPNDFEKYYAELEVFVAVNEIDDDLWHYKITDRDNGILHKDTYQNKHGRTLTLEAVANHVYTFYRDVMHGKTEPTQAEKDAALPEVVRQMVWFHCYMSMGNRIELDAVRMMKFDRLAGGGYQAIVVTTVDAMFYEVTFMGAGKTKIAGYTRVLDIEVSN